MYSNNLIHLIFGYKFIGYNLPNSMKHLILGLSEPHKNFMLNKISNSNKYISSCNSFIKKYFFLLYTFIIQFITFFIICKCQYT